LEESSVARSDDWRVVQVRVQATVTNQSVVGTLLLDNASIYDDNAVNPSERSDPVGNKNDCLVREMLC